MEEEVKKEDPSKYEAGNHYLSVIGTLEILSYLQDNRNDWVSVNRTSEETGIPISRCFRIFRFLRAIKWVRVEKHLTQKGKRERVYKPTYIITMGRY